MTRLAVLVAAATATGCIEIADPGGPWQELSEVSGSELGPLPTSRAEPGCTLRVVTWNLHKLANPDDVLANLAASSHVAAADVLLVQETATWPGEMRSRTAHLAERLAMTWAHTPVARLPDGVLQGNAILSRFPLERVQVKRLPHVEQPYHGQARSALAADVVLGDVRVRVVTIHLDVRLQITDRIRQLDPAVTDLDERAVVGGDFNTAPWQWIEGLVPVTSTEAVLGMSQAAILDDYMATRGFASAIPVDTNTFTLPGFSMRLDNLYPRALAIRDAGIEHVAGSDHWPLWVDVDVCD